MPAPPISGGLNVSVCPADTGLEPAVAFLSRVAFSSSFHPHASGECMQPRSLAPLPPPPDIEPIDDALAPASTRPRSDAGDAQIMLGDVAIGEFSADRQRAGYVSYRLTLPDLRSTFSRPLPVEKARAAVGETVRNWIDSTGIPAYLRRREQERAQRSGRAAR